MSLMLLVLVLLLLLLLSRGVAVDSPIDSSIDNPIDSSSIFSVFSRRLALVSVIPHSKMCVGFCFLLLWKLQTGGAAAGHGNNEITNGTVNNNATNGTVNNHTTVDATTATTTIT